MKEHDLTDRQLKIVFVLAMAIIGWFFFKGALSGHAQTIPAAFSSAHQPRISTASTVDYIRNFGREHSRIMGLLPRTWRPLFPRL